jgi:hypothetical protein
LVRAGHCRQGARRQNAGLTFETHQRREGGNNQRIRE